MAAVAVIAGIVVGAGGAIALRRSPAPLPPMQDQLPAAIAADLAHCSKPAAPKFDIPTVDEAMTAYRRVRDLPEATLRPGKCQPNDLGPVVQCSVKFRGKPTIRSGLKGRRGRSNSSSTSQTVCKSTIRPSPPKRGLLSRRFLSRLSGTESHKTRIFDKRRVGLMIERSR